MFSSKLNSTLSVLLLSLLLLSCSESKTTTRGTIDPQPDPVVPINPSPPVNTGEIFYDPTPAQSQSKLAQFSLRSRWKKSELKYFIYNFASNITTAEQQSIIGQAFDLWAAVTPLQFEEVGRSDDADILIGFGEGQHCDLYDVRGLSCPSTKPEDSFIGPAGVLGHAYFPGQAQQRLSGEMHLDIGEAWISTARAGSGISLLSVAAHEIGHSLGLDHSSDRSALMFPSYNNNVPMESLGRDDIAGIQSLYGSRDGNVTPTAPEPPTENVPTVQGCGVSTAIDFDGDGLFDQTELFQVGTNPSLCDTDGDGLPDSEIFVGLNPLLADTDSDGVNDGDEIAIGSNPLIPDQGTGAGIQFGRYLGSDSMGSGITLDVFPNGRVGGGISIFDPFAGRIDIPLIGGIDTQGRVVVSSYDYFFNLVGTFSPGNSISGQLSTVNGGFTTWSVSLASTFDSDTLPEEVHQSDFAQMQPKQNADAWSAYEPVIGQRKNVTVRSGILRDIRR